MRTPPKPRPCEHCGEMFQPEPYQERRIFCDKPECQEEKELRRHKSLKAAKINHQKSGDGPRIYKKRGVEIKKYRCKYIDTDGRRCKIWSVNRIYCQRHHSLVSDSCVFDGI